MQTFGNPFNVLTTIESTNNYAMARAHARLAKEGEAWFALDQTHGKGQRGKSWNSEPGENIMMSLVAEPVFLSPSNNFFLSAAAALSVHDLFNNYAKSTCTIKWPNDLYWNDRKAGGILIENLINATVWNYAIIGIGININQESFDPSLPNPVSLFQITQMKHDPLALARELCAVFQERYDALRDGRYSNLLQDYNERLYCRNRKHRFKEGPRQFEAKVLEVTPDGRLRLQAGGLEMDYEHGQIEWMMNNKALP